MNRLTAFFKARELFAHQRILVFWLVALIALAIPWLWLSQTDQVPVSSVAGGSLVVQGRDQRSPSQMP